jgi:DNA-binding NtrC family response regulator
MAETKAPSYIKDLSVLAVDDEKDILDTIVDVLDEGKVDRAEDYDSASQKLKDTKYDLAVLDIMGVNGLELLVEAVNKGIPTVMLTAHAMNPETLKASINKGALAYLPKEELSRLDELVNELLEAHKKGNSTWRLIFERLGDYFEKSFVPGWAKDDPEFWKYYGYMNPLGY